MTGLYHISNSGYTAITSNKFSIGRSLQNDLIVEDLSISRVHCVLEKIDSDWYVVDKSSNGTTVNKCKTQRNAPIKLKDSDTIELSECTQFRFSNTLFVDLIEGMEDGTVNCENTIYNVTDASPLRNISVTSNTESVNLIDVPKTVLNCTNGTDSNSKENKVTVSNVIERPTETLEPSCSKVSNTLNKTALEDELTCSICTELFIKAVTLNCSHSFCSFCISTWRKKHNICPICRATISSESATKALDNIIDQLVQRFPEDQKLKRGEIANERQQFSNTRKKPARRQRVRRTRLRNVVVEDPIEISSENSDIDDEPEFDDDVYVQMLLGTHAANVFDTSSRNRGPYYGGYGVCFKCHMPGHWANGCPNN